MAETAKSRETGATSDEIARLTTERDTFKKLYLDQLAINRMLENGIIHGQGRERVAGDASQLTMSILEMLTGGAGPAEKPAKQEIAAHTRAKPTGRQVPPEKLPRIDVEVLPPEVKTRGTDAFEKIGEDVTETVERRPASLVVVRVHKPKFVEKDRDLKQNVKVVQAEPPELPIERGLAGPGLLADTIVKRWEDHLPLHRLERIYGREGWELARSTVCGWHTELASLVQPLLEAMWQDAFTAPYLCVDATGVLVQHKEKCRKAHFFVVAAPEKSVLFGYTPKHNNAAVDKLLEGYAGMLVVDAHAVYEHLSKTGSITLSGCWAHARRYFFKSLSTEPVRARHAIDLIRGLFKIEEVMARASPEERLAVRKDQSKEIVGAFDSWCDLESLRVIDETPIAKAIGYARNQREGLHRFLEDGRLPIHNNWSERELRREALGRKNWLFVGNDEGGETNATFVSLIASCRLHEIDPATYLRDLFCLLPSWNVRHVLELAPSEWKTTVAREDVMRKLDENVYRRAMLGLS